MRPQEASSIRPGNASMQTVLIMAVGALVMLGLRALLRDVYPSIQQCVCAAVNGEPLDEAAHNEGSMQASGPPSGRPTPLASPTGEPISMRELLQQAAQMAYVGKPGDVTSDGQWRIAPGGLVEDHTGFRAIILTPADGSNTGAIVAFAGTDVKTSFGGGLNDLVHDYEQAVSGISGQYARAVRLAQALKERYHGNIYLTGHSLGGGQAALASALTHVPGAAFNPAPLGGIAAISSSIAEYGRPVDFTNYVNRFDPVSNLANVPYFPGRLVGQTVESSDDHGWPGFGLSDHLIENMRGSPTPATQGKVPSRISPDFTLGPQR